MRGQRRRLRNDSERLLCRNGSVHGRRNRLVRGVQTHPRKSPNQEPFPLDREREKTDRGKTFVLHDGDVTPPLLLRTEYMFFSSFIERDTQLGKMYYIYIYARAYTCIYKYI